MSDVTVHQALAAVMAALPAIGKDDHASPQQGGYAYRGIEAITGHVQPLFAQHGIITVPQVQSIDVRDLTVNGKPWTDTTLVVDYTLVGPDGSKLTATCVGVGRDNADKGANKAMTQAFKYLLLQVLCISDAKDDADGTTVAADAPSARDEMLAAFKRLTTELGIGTAQSRAAFVEATLGRPAKWSALSFAEKADLVAQLEEHEGGGYELTVEKDDAGRLFVHRDAEPFEVESTQAVDEGGEPATATAVPEKADSRPVPPTEYDRDAPEQPPSPAPVPPKRTR